MSRTSRGLAAVLLGAMFVGTPWVAYQLIRAGWSTGAITVVLTPVSLVVVLIARRLLDGRVAEPHRSDRAL